MSMRRARTTLVVLVAAAAIAVGTAGAQTAPKAKPAAKPAAAAPKHVMVAAPDVKWGPGPPSLPPGAQMAVLDGDPAVAGKPFVIRAKMPDGYRVPPHWHPTDENVTVIKGTFLMGVGEQFDASTATELGEGSYVRMPKAARHFAAPKGETIIQRRGTEPFELTYVNPADDPRKK